VKLLVESCSRAVVRDARGEIDFLFVAPGEEVLGSLLGLMGVLARQNIRNQHDATVIL
jgi:hypothetical protein